MIDRDNFSRQVKDEFHELLVIEQDHRKHILLACLFAAGKLRSGLIQLTTSHQAYGKLMRDLFEEVYQAKVRVHKGKELMSISIENRETYKQIAADLYELFAYDAALNRLEQKKALPDLEKTKTILRAVFQACGSIGDPRQAYHLEFSMRRQPAAQWVYYLLAAMGITASTLKRQGYSVLYLKEGQQISEFLLQLGAHISLLEFESLRVDKEMRNTVNRVVNCDSANLQRVANASARQLELIRRLSEQNSLSLLPQDLQLTAQARVENPSFSIKELGEVMDPPLGKSGMNHRLKKLERLALEILNQDDTI